MTHTGGAQDATATAPGTARPVAAAYELVEDGIGLQALTSPHHYGAAD